MPNLGLIELGNAVYREQIKGIVLDTSIFDQYRYGFEFGLLAKLQQFQRSTVAHVVIDVVRHELQRHLVNEAVEHKAHVKNALKPLGDSWGISNQTREIAIAGLFGVSAPK
ncbi:hypothetical protein [Variovorax paradoxus]|uniref:DUF4935 domain-containing protein n=1 Tax=Variovorax paradoxus TaxID=34073 RepID=A0A0H2LTG5_VARPD|nr:hypothetical protein [Variovorax paradoxus]KLN53543.1 hypothetical protein VPARA_53820 [Variovorax paradoxus]